MSRRCAIVLCVLSLTLFGFAPAWANPYVIQDVGPASDQGNPKMVAVNDLGQVVGTNPNTSHAFVWTASGEQVDLNSSLAAITPASSQAWDINDSGQICGTYTNSTGDHAFIYSASAGVTDLGTFMMPGYYGVAQATAYAINSSGQVGVSYTATILVDGGAPSPQQDIALVNSNGTIQATLTNINSVSGIDNAGDMEGRNDLVSPRYGWYLPYGSSTPQTLPVLVPGNVSSGQGMSDNGLICGGGYNSAAGVAHAMLWTSPSSAPTDLGSLGSTSVAYGVNDSGTVVGGSIVSGSYKAFVWTSGTGMVNLNAPGVVGNLATSGFSTLTWGVDVNNLGQIAGFGTIGGVTDAFLLTPALSGDANLDGRVDINDLTVVLAHYDQTGMTWTEGEFTGSGTVDINDLTVVLANYNESGNYGSPAGGLVAVPEPASLGLLAAAIASAALWLWRRRG
jgi:probable HAF family extracellular repeat protein